MAHDDLHSAPPLGNGEGVGSLTEGLMSTSIPENMLASYGNSKTGGCRISSVCMSQSLNLFEGIGIYCCRYDGTLPLVCCEKEGMGWGGG